MVFFNYSTMQMAAKIVYYGPGLCGKTTNLQHIYGHTSKDSRGEMVSLETETDRTLFFDLLPIDVGSIQGFNTRIQLYTVPGQVFYNTTRKLVLKGVDGVVFVADSQRAMLDANIESFRNLEENLAEINLSIDELPLVLQYNKRDLADICSVEELDQALNRGGWQSYTSEAVSGKGVFETLKGISKLTLLSLKKRIRDGRKVAEEQEQQSPKSAPSPQSAQNPQASASPPPEVVAEPQPVEPARERSVDILAELEKIRQKTLGDSEEATSAAAGPVEPTGTDDVLPSLPPDFTDQPLDAPGPTPFENPLSATNGAAVEASRGVDTDVAVADPPTSTNGHRTSIAKELAVGLSTQALTTGRVVCVQLRVHDESSQVVETVEQIVQVDEAELEGLSLHLQLGARHH